MRKKKAYVKPLIITEMRLTKRRCSIVPTLKEIQSILSRLVLNVVETHYAVNTWGKLAKTTERAKIRPLIGEIRHERNWFKMVSEHKHIQEYFELFAGGLMMLENDVQRKLIQVYDSCEYFWKMDPFMVPMEEKPDLIEKIQQDLAALVRSTCIGPLKIRMEQVQTAALFEFAQNYRRRMNEISEFINDNNQALSKTLEELDDIKMAMEKIKYVQDNFTSIDVDLNFIEKTFHLLERFAIGIQKEEIDLSSGLREGLKAILRNIESTENQIVALQVPLTKELTLGAEQLREDIENFDEEFETTGPMEEGISAKDASDRVTIFQGRYDELVFRMEVLASGETFMGLKVNEYPILAKRKKDLNLLNKLYSLYLQVMKSVDEYYETSWANVDIEKISNELADFQNRCRKLPKGMKDWPAFIDLKKKIDDFNESAPLLELIANPAMKDRHWQRLENMMSHKFDIESPFFTVGNVMEAPLLQYKDDIEDICLGAMKEADIEIKLKQVASDWSNVNLQFAQFKLRGELLLRPQETMEIIGLLEDSTMVVSSLASNRFNAHFKKDIMSWLHKMVNTSEILEKWLMVQNLWIYLEAVFIGGDISKQLPQDAKKFANIDKSWVRLMFRARYNPNVIQCCTDDDTMSYTLPFLLEQLEQCQKALTGYLESKRLIFPRFFFISDPVLLDILGQSSDPSSIQPHLLSLFDAIARVQFDAKNPNKIVAMHSANGEKVPLEKVVECKKGVEYWLGSLLAAMQDTINGILANMAQSLKDPEFEFITEFPNFCGQAALVGVQLLWTKEAEIALRRCRVDKFIMKETNTRFLDLLNSLIELTVKDLTVLQRIQFETMVRT
jgi:dynein heavy chain